MDGLVYFERSFTFITVNHRFPCPLRRKITKDFAEDHKGVIGNRWRSLVVKLWAWNTLSRMELIFLSATTITSLRFTATGSSFRLIFISWSRDILYLYINSENDKNFKNILLLSLCLFVISIGFTDIMLMVYLIIIFGILSVIYRKFGTDQITEYNVENGSVIKIFYNNIERPIIFIHSILIVIYVIIYVKFITVIASTI